MIDSLKQVIKKNWKSLGRDDECDINLLSLTKFCQRIVGEHTKVLFFITYRGKPLCILKIMRSYEFNEKLKKEASVQQKIFDSGLTVAPKVFFEDTVDGGFIYAEEIVQGMPISRKMGQRMEEEVVSIVSSFPTYGNTTVDEVRLVIEKKAPKEDEKIQEHILNLKSNPSHLKKGLTHNDFGRPNILFDGSNVRIIDWERAGEGPIWLIDAVYFIVRFRQIHSIKEWDEIGVPLLIKYTGIEESAAKSLYSIAILLKRLYKRYPDSYKKVVEDLAL